MANQTHIFCTRADLVPGLRSFESHKPVKYVRCDLYYEPVYEQYRSLLEWDGLGKNVTGDHNSGARFLILPMECELEDETVHQQVSNAFKDSFRPAWPVDENGALSRLPVSVDDYLSELEDVGDAPHQSEVRYNVSQKLNPESISFSPGGIYKEQRMLVCGHIGTVSKSRCSQDLYRDFVKTLTKGFVKIGSYKVGPEAESLMDQGYRMVTISISSPRNYDLRRSK